MASRETRDPFALAGLLANHVVNRLKAGQDIRASVLFGRGRFTIVAFWETRESAKTRAEGVPSDG
jgi:hypothetical protein